MPGNPAIANFYYVYKTKKLEELEKLKEKKIEKEELIVKDLVKIDS